MGLRFSRRVRLAPGITLNLSKGGASVSVGPKGVKLTVGTSGASVSLGLPGTGLYWTHRVRFGGGGDDDGAEAKAKGKAKAEDKPPSPAHLAWEEGVVALHEDRLDDAIERLAFAWTHRDTLPGGDSEVEVPLTAELTYALAPDPRGAGLAYAEVLQWQDRLDEAAVVLRQLKAEADSPVIRVSLAELELDRSDPAGALAACGRSRDPMVGLYRARAKLAAGRAADAIREVQRLLADAPPDLRDDLEQVAAAARAGMDTR